MPRDDSPEALYRPQTRPVFVRADAMPRFETEAPAYSVINAWWLANAAHLSYYDEAGVRRELAKAGFELVEYFLHGGTEAFLATGAGFAILAFRGTQRDDWDDIKADIKFPLVPFSAGTRAHEGFRDALGHVWAKVEPRLADLAGRGLRVWYTGHSLGAALATLAAARRRPAGLYTFGSPRVGDGPFLRLLEGVSTVRFVDCCDIVPTMPPEWLGYRHTGELRYITAGRRVLVDPSSLLVFYSQFLGIVRYGLRFPFFRRNTVGFRSLSDHAIVNYTAGIERSMERLGLMPT